MSASLKPNASSLMTGLPRSSAAVLASGGILSAVLLAQALDHFSVVYPVYGRFGLPWQETEEQHLRRFLAAIRGPRLGRLKVLDLPVDDIYSKDGHIQARLLPDDDPGGWLKSLERDLLLISKAAAWGAVNGIEVIAAGPGASERPGADEEEAFDKIESVIRLGLGQPVRLVRPLAALSKAQVLQFGRDLPLEFTFSCIRPVFNEGSAALHCGRCHKCVDRQRAFAAAALTDRTRYAEIEAQRQ